MALIKNRFKTYKRIQKLSKIYFFIIRYTIASTLLIIMFYISLFYSKKISSFGLELFGHYTCYFKSIYNKTLKTLNYNLSYFQDIQKKNIKLKLEIVRLKNSLAKIELLENENKALRNILSCVEEVNSDYVTAKLISSIINPLNKIALVSAGKKQGIKTNQIVTYGNNLIGRIIQVSDNYSKIILLNDINSRIPIITSISKEEGMLTGESIGCKIIYLSEIQNLQENEIVITSGKGSIYKRGLIVGRVKKNNNEVMVVPSVDISKIEFVNILNNLE